MPCVSAKTRTCPSSLSPGEKATSGQDVPVTWLRELMLNALSSSVQLQYDVQQFRRDENLSYDSLIELLRRQVTRIERDRNQVTWLRSVQTPVSSIAPSPAVPAATPALCAFYPSGRCTRGSACRHPHAVPALPVYPQSPSAPSRPRPPQQTPVSGQQHGTNVPKVGIPTTAVPKRPCFRFADGQHCDASSCRYEHRQLTAEEARVRALSRDASNRGVCL